MESRSGPASELDKGQPTATGWARAPLIPILRTLIRLAPRGFKPAVQNGLIRAVYEVVSAWDKTGVTFLNYGYVSLDSRGSSLKLRPEDEQNRLKIQLYHRVVGSIDVRGKDVLEVGCGRGGGASFVMRYLGPRTVTGLDLAALAVVFCRRRHRVEGLTFTKGDAQNLPIPDESFDVVVNVESSHTYPSFERFLREVARVLRPGGHFLVSPT